MGNATRPRTSSSPKQNVSHLLNQVRRQMNNHRAEARNLRKEYNNMGPRFRSNTFTQNNVIRMHLIPAQLAAVVRSYKSLERLYWRLFRQQMDFESSG